MPKTLTFLHTSPVHVATFDRLLAELDPSVPAKHIVDVSLLQDAQASGITPDVANRVAQTIEAAIADDAALVVCTCSTIGGCAEAVNQSQDHRVVRIDRAMAERAVASGNRILVVAALASTLLPTRQLILDVAAEAGKDITLRDSVCADAWAHFERGDRSAYLERIAECLRQAAADADVIVLAQASMADAVALCSDLPVPILSSPRLGLAAAVDAYHSHIAASEGSLRMNEPANYL